MPDRLPLQRGHRDAVKPAREASFPLSFRIPGWCRNPELSVNGSGIETVADANGFVRVDRLWKPGDAVCLRFPMSASVKTGRDKNAQGAPYASVSYGPLLFALPIPDTQGPNTPDPAAAWKYALDVQGEKLEHDIVVERQPMPAKWDWPLASPLKLRVNGVAIDWNPTAKRLVCRPPRSRRRRDLNESRSFPTAAPSSAFRCSRLPSGFSGCRSWRSRLDLRGSETASHLLSVFSQVPQAPWGVTVCAATRSCLEIAESPGSPAAGRAVGQAPDSCV